MEAIFNKIKNSVSYIYGMPQERKITKFANYCIANKYKRIYFYHVRKAAGKSVTDIIMSLEGKDHYVKYGELYSARNHRIIYNDKIFVGWHPILIQKGNYYYAFSHIPYHEIKIPEETFTFTCLRDPVARVISYYNMLQRFKKNISNANAIDQEVQYLGDTFNKFLDNIPKYRLLNQLYMFSKEFSISEASDRILGLSHYFFIDNFAEGIKVLGSKLGLKLEVLHTDKAVNKNSIPEETISQLKDILTPEYDLISQLKINSLI